MSINYKIFVSKVLPFIYCLSVSTFIYAQNNKTIKVTNFDTSKALEYATCYLTFSKNGAISNSDGIAYITNLHKKDSLIVTYLGYNEIKIDDVYYKQQDTIFVKLKKKVFDLDEVVIIPKEIKEITLGCSRKFKSKTISRGQGFMYKRGSLLSIPDSIGKYMISTFSLRPSFFLGIPPNPKKTSVRFNIYNVNKDTKLPGESILNKNIILFPNKRKKWIDFNLKNYNIILNEKEIYIVVETLQNQPKKNKMYGLTIKVHESNQYQKNKYVVFYPKTNRWYTIRDLNNLSSWYKDNPNDDNLVLGLQIKIIPIEK